MLNFINLSTLYFQHNDCQRSIHVPVVSAPLAWNFVAIYWNGAFLVQDQDSLAARTTASIFIWGILGYGLFFISIYKVSILPRVAIN